MRDISMERVNETRKNILEIIESATLTHEQKLTLWRCWIFRKVWMSF